MNRRAFLQGLLASTALAPALLPAASGPVWDFYEGNQIPLPAGVGTASSTWGTCLNGSFMYADELSDVLKPWVTIDEGDDEP